MINYTALGLYFYNGFRLAFFAITGKIGNLGAVKIFQHFRETTVRTFIPVFLHPATIFLSGNICLLTSPLYTTLVYFAIQNVAMSQKILYYFRLRYSQHFPDLLCAFPRTPSMPLFSYTPPYRYRSGCGYIFPAYYSPCRTVHTP